MAFGVYGKLINYLFKSFKWKIVRAYCVYACELGHWVFALTKITLFPAVCSLKAPLLPKIILGLKKMYSNFQITLITYPNKLKTVLSFFLELFGKLLSICISIKLKPLKASQFNSYGKAEMLNFSLILLFFILIVIILFFFSQFIFISLSLYFASDAIHLQLNEALIVFLIQ